MKFIHIVAVFLFLAFSSAEVTERDAGLPVIYRTSLLRAAHGDLLDERDAESDENAGSLVERAEALRDRAQCSKGYSPNACHPKACCPNGYTGCCYNHTKGCYKRKVVQCCPAFGACTKHQHCCHDGPHFGCCPMGHSCMKGTKKCNPSKDMDV